MITDRLKNAHLYHAISSYFEAAFNFIRQLDETTENGEYEIMPGLKAYVMEYDTSGKFQFGWEAHKKHIDIQYCLRGIERIQWTPLLEELTPSIPYDEDNDRTFFYGDGQQTYIDTGNEIFAVFFPEDAHAPQLMVDKPAFIKKVVVKVPVELDFEHRV